MQVIVLYFENWTFLIKKNLYWEMPSEYSLEKRLAYINKIDVYEIHVVRKKRIKQNSFAKYCISIYV